MRWAVKNSVKIAIKVIVSTGITSFALSAGLLTCLPKPNLSDESGPPSFQRVASKQLPDELYEIVDRSNKTFADWAEKDHAILKSIIEAYRKSVSPQSNWVGFLDNLRLEALPIDFLSNDEQKADAKTGIGRGESVDVKVTQEFLILIRDKSYGAAISMASSLTGRNLKTENGVKETFDLLSQKISIHVMAWIVAHELAHNRLGHLGRKPATLAQSRNDKIAADKLAFEMMNDAGFSLFLLSQYFKTMKALEDIRSPLGMATQEEMSSHPSWDTRYAILRQAMKSLPLVEQRWVTHSFLEFTARDHQLVKTVFLYPRDTCEHLGFVVYDFKTIIAVGVERGPGNIIYLYSRAGDNVLRYTISDRSAHITSGSVQSVKGDVRVQNEMPIYRDSLAAISMLDDRMFI